MFAAAGRLTGNAAIATRSAAAVLATTSVVSYGVLHQQKQTEHDKSNLNLSNASCDAVVTASTSASGVHARLDANKLRKRVSQVCGVNIISVSQSVMWEDCTRMDGKHLLTNLLTYMLHVRFFAMIQSY
jgi:hypothetical protein